MAPTLTLETLKWTGVLLAGSITLSILGSLAIPLTLTCGCCSTTSRYVAGWGSLSQTTSAIMGTGMTRSSSVCSPSPTTTVSGTIWSAAQTVTLPCSCQGSHQPGYLVSQLWGSFNRLGGHSWPCPHLVLGCFIFAVHLVGSDHKLGVHSIRVAIKVAYWNPYVFSYPMKETVLEVLLHLLICNLSEALQPDLV